MVSADDIKNLVVTIIPKSFTLEELVAKVTNLFLLLAGILAFFYLLYAGILYITSGNSPEQARKAQQAMINVLIGIIIIMVSYVLVRTVGSVIVTVFK